VRAARVEDLPRLTAIYNHFVERTHVTFDEVPFTVAQRRAWFDAHAPEGKHRLLVAEERGEVVGYASTSKFRPKPGYDTTAEASVYCAPEAIGRGIGTLLYGALFDAVAKEDLHRIVAGIALPNEASLALHARFGFQRIGTFTGVGRKFGRYWDVAWLERPMGR
jgi:phosphinothricin acetyltransferase